MAKKRNTEQTPENTDVNANANSDFTPANGEKTEVITVQTEVNKDFTPNLNIRNARVTDVNYIKSFAVDGKSVSDALSHVVKLAQTEKSNSVPLKEDEVILTISEQLHNYASASDTTVEDTIKRLFTELQTEKENALQFRKLAENMALQPNQSIVTFDPKTADNIRKARPFISKQNYIVYEKNNNVDFVNKLANHAINKVLRIDFDNVVNPL